MIDIEKIVRQILADLAPAQSPTLVPAPVSSKKVDGETRITNQLVTLDDVKALFDTTKRLIVPEKAVITPTVRDELRKRNIELVTSKKTVSQGATGVSGGKLRVWLALHLLKKQPGKLIEGMAKEHDLKYQTFECVLEATQQAAAELKIEPDRSLAVVLTNYSAGALCVANRYPNVRAVLAYDAASLKIDLQQTGANLLVADPDRAGAYKIQEFLKIFLNGLRKPPKYLATF